MGDPALPGSDPSSLNFTIPDWYGIRTDLACDYGQLLNTSISGLNITATFVDRNGGCVFRPDPFPVIWPFGFATRAVDCRNNSSQIVAQGGSIVFVRLTPSRLAVNDTTAAVVIYCRPSVIVLSVDATLDLRTKALLSVDNVRPLSSEQQQRYDPTNFTTEFLVTHPWNGFSIDPAIDTNVPALLIDELNKWLNLTISVDVGGQWLNKSTILQYGIVTDDPQACTLSSLHKFFISFMYDLLAQTAMVCESSI